MPDFFISFQVFPNWVNKFRTLRENIFGRIFKIEFCVCRETLWVSKKKRERDHSEWSNPENKVYILRQWFFFVIFYDGKCCLLLLLLFFFGLVYRKRVLLAIHRCLVSTNCTFWQIWVKGLSMVRKKREVHITEIRLARTNKSMRPY